MHPHAMTAAERRAVGTLAAIFSLRLFGLFAILPVFVLYAAGLPGATETLVGLSLGAYGLTQALLQIPYGALSDRFGRKPLILVGLLVFAAGSVLAAVADSIWGMLAGRALQGAGAIAAVVIALAADLTREAQRTKAMALMGMTIGATFLLSLVLGPVLKGWIGVPGIFWLTAGLALLGIGALARVPTPVQARRRPAGPAPARLLAVLRDPALWRLDAGIFILHTGLTAMFVVVPVVLAEEIGLDPDRHWRVYLPVILASVVGMLPLVWLSSRRHLIRPIFTGALALVLLAQALLALGHREFPWLVAGLWVYFVGFNVLEALLPSLVSRLAPAEAKGAAVGVYNSFEFLGVFAGGALGGWLHGALGMGAVFTAAGVLVAVWLVIVWTAPPMRLLDSRVVPVRPAGEAEARALAARLLQVPGVEEAVVVLEEGVAYLKVDTRILDTDRLEAATGG